LTQIDDGSSNTTYGYDPNGNRLTCALPNGVITTNSYDALNRVMVMDSHTASATIHAVGYAYDLVGNRLNAIENMLAQGVRTNNYGYDAQYRLTIETSALNSLLSTNTYSYDLAGNRLILVHAEGTNDAVTTAYAYDDLNRLLKGIATTQSASVSTNEYAYD